ncbi:MAG: hypothetical protein NTY39_11415 [Campylobacterales bacterium]|nr:hypothetical protein [Campylobacterales bacterium]
MNWLHYFWEALFPKKSLKIPHYGRAIHALPNPKEHELFDLSATAFSENNILLGYRYFLESLQHTNNHDHLILTENNNSIAFTLYQGSAILHGRITPETFRATAHIAKASALHVAIKRRFLERNFQLTYCRFSEKEDDIVLGIQLHNTTITPQKIFFPLRELALNADFEKEFISSEFDESALLEVNHIIPCDLNRLQRLYETMKRWIASTQSSLIGLLSNDNNGMASFSYLALLLQIDYLLIPHKKMAKEINEKINTYFMEDEKLTQDKNSDLEIYLDELSSMPFETFKTQFYHATTTFSPFEHALHDDIAEFIEESLGKVRWYKNNHTNYVIPVIYHYISLYILFNYGIHPSLRALFHLHVQVYASEFFADEGEIKLYENTTGTFQKQAISNAIETAIKPYQSRYKNLKSFADQLNFSDLNHFSQSFYLQIKNLDYQEV